jgi:uncharacterized Ntn-hydrolase superfamily protein
MTYSIVARDASTGELGVAVQTCFFAVGTIAPWARPGIGAVATQAIAEPAYGPRCLDALANGKNAAEALADAQAVDEMPAVRQVGVVGADGSVTSFTGELCIDHAGNVTGDGFTAQGNMLSSPDVWPAIAEAFENSTGPLARRLLAALRAGDAAGGDARGRMSAALLVVEGSPADHPAAGTVVDLRVDRSDDPLGELARLLDAADAFAGFGRSFEQLLGGDPDGAVVTVDQALEILPREDNLRFLRGGALIASGATDEGVAELRSLLADHPTWEVIVRSFANSGLMSLPEGVSVDSILG